MQDAATRIELVNCDLAETHTSVTAGYAELAADDSLATLVTRADEAMYKERIGDHPLATEDARGTPAGGAFQGRSGAC